MARIRTVKPEFWTHEELSALPEATHLLAAALLNYADDFGYFNANVGLIRAACSPLREPSVSIPESLRSLQAMGYLRFGTAPDGKRYGHIVHFDEHQRVSHPTKSKIASLPITWDDSGNPPESLRNPPESFRPEQGTGNKEQGTGKGKERARESDPHEVTQAIQGEYPKGTYGKQNWILAERCIAKLLDEGESASDLATSARLYADQQRAKGSIGTQFIRSPEKFFGDGFWRGPFPLPATKADARLAGNISAADEFMRRTEPVQ